MTVEWRPFGSSASMKRMAIFAFHPCIACTQTFRFQSVSKAIQSVFIIPPPLMAYASVTVSCTFYCFYSFNIDTKVTKIF